MKRVVSIIIPAYNVEDYLERCLKSIESELGRIEAIIVNDGSTDKTLSIAKKWGKKYPDDIKVIDKENGGHGSTINVGLKCATGKYIRVLDSDDWLNETTLSEYLDTLENATTDVILTDYDIKKRNYDQHITFSGVENNKKLSVEDSISLRDKTDYINLFSIHTITVKLDCIRKEWGDGLLEKTLYEDQEWVSRIISAANNYIYVPISVYQYFLDRDEQSMNRNKMFTNRDHHERVILRLVDLIKKNKSEKKRAILKYRLAIIMRTHYWIYFYQPRLSKEEKIEYKQLKRKLKPIIPEAFSKIDMKYKLRLFLGRKKQELKK